MVLLFCLAFCTIIAKFHRDSPTSLFQSRADAETRSRAHELHKPLSSVSELLQQHRSLTMGLVCWLSHCHLQLILLSASLTLTWVSTSGSFSLGLTILALSSKSQMLCELWDLPDPGYSTMQARRLRGNRCSLYLPQTEKKSCSAMCLS